MVGLMAIVWGMLGLMLSGGGALMPGPTGEWIIPPLGFLRRDLKTVTTGAFPVRLEASIIGWTILLRALMNLEDTEY